MQLLSDTFTLDSDWMALPRLLPPKGLKGFTRKGLQSRSATASLLIKSCKCIEEGIKLVVLQVVLAHN